MSRGRDNNGPGNPDELAGLASLAFGRGSDAEPTATRATRHLAFLTIEALELDLSDPEQRNFGDYELLEYLGAGGMGVVYRARQKSLDREVAIKLLSAGPWASRDFIGRFEREAQSAARLQHPNIVAIHEIGSRDELNYFSMALVRGPNLAQLLAERGTMPGRQAAKLVRTIAEALHYAHSLGVLHLDLKPGNVLTAADGEPQVADFGLARRIDVPLSPEGDEVSGTPNYMAPEQIEPGQQRVGVATDIYGLGAILYELLTGHPPYSAATTKQTLALVMDGRLRRLGRYRDDIPADLEAICFKCLRKQPQGRYANARLLADDLGRFLDDRPVSVRPLSRWQRILRWSRREPLLAVTVALASVAVLIGLVSSTWQWQRAESSASIARQHLWAQRHETAWRLFEEGRNYQAMPLLASNLREQEAGGDDEAAAMERMRLQATQSQMPALLEAIDVGARVHVVALSPDGRHVALGLDPDRVALYEVATGRQLWRVTLDVYDKSDTDTQLRKLLFTPDLRWLLVTEHPTGSDMRPSGRLTYRLAVADGAQTRVPATLRLPQVRSESWSDDGRYVLLSDRRSWLRFYDASTWQPLSPARRLPIASFHGWQIAPQARFVAMFNGFEGVSILDPRTLQPRQALPQPYGATRFVTWAISPDARWLALGRMNGEILLVDVTSGHERLLRPAGSRSNWLSFTADSRRLAVALQDGDFVVLSLPRGETMYSVRRETQLWGHQLECNDTAEPTLEECIALLMEFDKVTLWSMTGAGVLSAGAVLRAPEITHHSFVPRFASAISGRHGLLVTGGQDGSLRLWRLPRSPLLARLAPTQRETSLRFDGRHLVGVDGDTVQVFDVRTGASASPPMRVPDAVGFAALVDDRSLVVSSGPELHVFDWRSGRRRYPPILLGGSPMDLIVAPDGRTVVSRWLGPDSRDGHSLLQAHALADGRALGPPADSRYQEGRIIEGDRLLVSEPDASLVYALSDLRLPRLRFPAPPDIRVPFTAHAPAGDELVQYLETEDALRNSLQWWSLRDGRRLQTVPLAARVDNLQVRARDGRIAISGNPGFTAGGDVAILFEPYGRRIPITTTRRDSLTRAQAFSADGRLLAQALHKGVIVIDTDSGTPMTPTLKQSLPEPDRIAQLAFGPDSRQLVARTALGRWLYWTLEGDPRPSGLIDAEVALLSPTQGSTFAAPDVGLRDSLREREATGPASVELQPSAWSCLPAIGTVPPRPPHLSATLLDLSALYTQSLHEAVDSMTDIMVIGNLCGMPLGRQRLRGVDYDVRGLLHLHHPDSGTPVDAPARPSGTGRLAVVPGRYAGMYVLNTLGSRPLQQDAAVAEIRFHYRDGSQARIPMHTWYEDYVGANGPVGPGVRRAWIGSIPEAESFFGDFSLFESHVRNPHPERELVSIDLQTTTPLQGPWGLGVVAITLESATATTASTDAK